MEVDKQRFNDLLDRYLNKECSAEEFAEFFSCLEDPGYDELMQERMKGHLKTLSPGAEVHQIDWDNMYRRIVQQDANAGRVRRMFGRRWTAAAAILVLCLAGLTWWMADRRMPAQESFLASSTKDIPPGTDQAVLQLADGSRITLGTVNQGVLTRQGHTVIKQQARGVLRYDGSRQTNQDQALLRNTLSVPAGGKYMIILPDQSKVWLNSNSSLVYAVAFNGAKREVELKGEAYFEIAKDARHPFVVKSGRSAVEVLGTHFNILSYPDENLSQVTLCEGSVRLKVGQQTAVLRPGQQASFSRLEDVISLREIDVEEAVDWKNGYFQFDNAEINQVMDKIKRWYNVGIVYQGTRPAAKFTGMISRDNQLSKILSLLQSTGGVNFEIHDHQVIVKNR